MARASAGQAPRRRWRHGQGAALFFGNAGQRRQHQTGRRLGRLGIRLQRCQGAAQAFQPAMGLGVLAQVSLHLTTAGGVKGIEHITNQVLVHGFQASFMEGD